jgi:hypothetical protein
MYFAERWGMAHQGKFREVIREHPWWQGRAPKGLDDRS